MRKIYLCGGINGLSTSDCKDWREYAKLHLVALTLDPMRRDFRGMERNFSREIVSGDKADLRECDAVLVNAERPSWGTAMEVMLAHQFNKPTVAFLADPQNASPWLRVHTSKLVHTIDQAIAWLNSGE